MLVRASTHPGIPSATPTAHPTNHIDPPRNLAIPRDVTGVDQDRSGFWASISRSPAASRLPGTNPVLESGLADLDRNEEACNSIE